MTNQVKPQLTDEQMNDLVFADVNDPSAWGEPVIVGPSKGPRRIKRAKHLELASTFYVLSVLHRLGVDATLTFSQADNVDLTVVLESGNALTVDIKTLTGPLEWHVADFTARPNHYFVFVWYPDSGEPTVPPTAFVVGSEQLKGFIAAHESTVVVLPQLDQEVQAREAWHRLAVPAAA
jgi:hypothetical protein